MIDPNMSLNAPLRTLYLVRQQAAIARLATAPVRSSIVGHYWPAPPPESVRDALDSLDLHLDAIVEMCNRYEPFRIEPTEEP